MSYLLEDETDQINEDIINRKEFYQYKMEHDHLEESIIPRFDVNNMIRDSSFLQFHSYQLFVSNYINPNTPYSRLLIKWQTGTGKSIAALAIASNFIKYFQKEELNGVSNIGSVFIIGFTSHVFKNELLRFPEFGIISKEELKKLDLLKKVAYNGSRFDKEHLQEYLIKIKKRLNSRTENGFYQFIGYKKLVNMVFDVAEGINISELDESAIKTAIADKKILLNTKLLDEFKNSLIICDEIHNVYNSIDKNNWGVALQYILDYHPSIRAVFMSATPINNNPSEVIDLLNLLLPITYYPKLIKTDFFESDKVLKKNALEKLADLAKGRVSYLRDDNPIYFPTRNFIGESINNVAYLKFVRCPMSEFHYNTYKTVYDGALNPDSQYLTDFAIPNPENNNIGLYQTSELKKILPYASQEWKDKNKINFVKDKIVGEILKLENLSKISNKFAKMMETINNIIQSAGGKMFIYHNVIHMSGVLFIQEILLQNYIIGEYDSSTPDTLCAVCGDPRHMHTASQIGGGATSPITNLGVDVRYNSNLDTYEIYQAEALVMEYSKYDDYIIIRDKFINKKNKLISSIIKSFASYGRVILELNKSKPPTSFKLKYTKNNLKYYANTDDDNYLIKDIIKKFNHKTGGAPKNASIIDDHSYTPVRFISVHSELDRDTMDASIDKYNSPDNTNGYRIMILIGGKIIKEAYDIKAVRELMIMGRPDNIPTLIQILGRAVRKNSHKLLPKDKHTVNIRIFTSCVPKKNGIYELSYEEEKYAEKIQHYKVIQQIEKTLHENAIDALINKDFIWPVGTSKNADLGPVYFEPNIKHTFKLKDLNLQTFNAFHTNAEIDNIVTIIKRLFIERSTVWTYADLLESVKNSNKWLNIEFNAHLVDENSFVIALSRLLYISDKNYTEPIIQTSTKRTDSVNDVLDKIYDVNDKIIILPGPQSSVIVQFGIYYILLPLDENINEPSIIPESQYRINKTKTETRINVKMVLESGISFVNYTDKRDRFFKKWNNISIEKLEMAVCDFGIDFHIAFLEECIKYVFDVWIDPAAKKSVMHTFYFKMLNYYDIRKLVIWAHTLKHAMALRYEKYLIPVSVEIKNDKTPKDSKVSMSTSGLINMLKSSINRSDINWISTGFKKQFDKTLEDSLKLFDGNYKKNTKQHKVNADLIPVGHFISHLPKFYHPDSGWFESPDYITSSVVFVENDIIVGYDERSNTGIHIRFKVRSPIQNITQFKDSRLIEKGSVCSSKSKIYLKEMAAKLGIKQSGKINVTNLCNDIRTKLIYLELKERLANTNKKFFYFTYERRPETVLE